MIWRIFYDSFIQAVQRDGSVVELGADQEELRRLMETELLAVQIACLAGLSRIIDWTVLSSRRGAILLSPPVQVRIDDLVYKGWSFQHFGQLKNNKFRVSVIQAEWLWEQKIIKSKFLSNLGILLNTINPMLF